MEDYNIAEDMNYGCEDDETMATGFKYQTNTANGCYSGEYYEETEYY